MIAYIFRDIWRVARISMEDLLWLILPCLSFSDFLLLLGRDLARPCCVTVVLAIEKAEQLLGLITIPSSTEASPPSASWSWWSV
jgi:hypothetical protein